MAIAFAVSPKPGMDSPRQRCTRLVAALEDLADQEAASVRMGDFSTVISLQQRAAPLVAELADRGPAIASADDRRRIKAVIERREKTAAEIGVRMKETKAQLDSLQARERRVSQIAPVYGRPHVPRNRLSAVG